MCKNVTCSQSLTIDFTLNFRHRGLSAGLLRPGSMGPRAPVSHQTRVQRAHQVLCHPAGILGDHGPVRERTGRQARGHPQNLQEKLQNGADPAPVLSPVCHGPCGPGQRGPERHRQEYRQEDRASADQ